ncbi:hypothetical protein [Spirosoma oryzicola]|uniref:hypothetical protein n=1 Tax=Spirosoma oryzicola TaxID=2898794 RepID=UPI001E58537E|nr:hypothetical protein [Spirosoma oryzicola]UHG93454.1 hypothetical protein LQ777_11230 [Spirosoma oryzicola]
MQKLISWANGNPGAMQFLIQLYNSYVSISAPIIGMLEQATTIRGTNLYVLWSDLCDKDMNKVSHLCQHCPQDILEDACSRQDWSGRNLVAPYLAGQEWSNES